MTCTMTVVVWIGRSLEMTIHHLPYSTLFMSSNPFTLGFERTMPELTFEVQM